MPGMLPPTSAPVRQVFARHENDKIVALRRGGGQRCGTVVFFNKVTLAL